MRMSIWNERIALALMLGLASGAAIAKLPPQTPEQQQAAAIKKAQAAEQAAKEKQQLAESMDRIAERWRGRAAKEGWKTNAATPVAAPAQAAQAGQPAPAQPAMLGAPPNAQQGVPMQQGVPIRSEKFGTAPPSEDVKTNEKSGARLQERVYKNPVEEPPHKKPSK